MPVKMPVFWCWACTDDARAIDYVDEDLPGRTPDFSRCTRSDMDSEHMLYYSSLDCGAVAVVTAQPRA